MQRLTTEQATKVRAAFAAEHNGHRYEWSPICAGSWREWKEKARSILRENGIPDSVRIERWTHIA